MGETNNDMLEIRLAKSEADHNLTQFRLNKLEEAVTSLSEMKDAFLRLEAKLGNVNLVHCELHTARMEMMDKRMSAAEESLESTKKFMNRSIGAIAVLSVLIQLVGPVLIDKFKESKPQPVIQVKSNGTNVYHNIDANGYLVQ